MCRTGLTLAQPRELRQRDPEEYVRRSTATMVVHVDAMLALQRAGAVAFDYGNNIRRVRVRCGMRRAFLIPGFVPEYIRPLFCDGRRAVSLGCAVGRSGGYRRDR